MWCKIRHVFRCFAVAICFFAGLMLLASGTGHKQGVAVVSGAVLLVAVLACTTWLESRRREKAEREGP